MRDRASCRDPQETVAAEPRHVSRSALCASRWRILRQKFLPTPGGKPGSCRGLHEKRSQRSCATFSRRNAFALRAAPPCAELFFVTPERASCRDITLYAGSGILPRPAGNGRGRAAPRFRSALCASRWRIPAPKDFRRLKSSHGAAANSRFPAILFQRVQQR